MDTTTDEQATIVVEEAVVLQQTAAEEQQFLLHLQAPEIVSSALPGQFVHIQCDTTLLMRRPMSIMRVDKKEGTLEMLYKIYGEGTELLSKKSAGDVVELIGPIGNAFDVSACRPHPVLLGGGVGIPPVFFLAEHIRHNYPALQPTVFLGSELPFPFKVAPSQILVSGLPPEATACMQVLDDWGIPSRLSSLRGFPGCYEGHVTDLLRCWLTANPGCISEVELFVCGPQPMLQAAAALAAEYQLPCQVSLEEYMACAVGGCAGCVVPLYDAAGKICSMKRVCVDGPIFNAQDVFQ